MRRIHSPAKKQPSATARGETQGDCVILGNLEGIGRCASDAGQLCCWGHPRWQRIGLGDVLATPLGGWQSRWATVVAAACPVPLLGSSRPARRFRRTVEEFVRRLHERLAGICPQSSPWIRYGAFKVLGWIVGRRGNPFNLSISSRDGLFTARTSSIARSR